ncbi:tetratricopeptide repeat protein [Sphingobacterium phlebotomi]|uniref:histidine kinase n=1 Tax=Sphingobacterium phlebotomi TaxID=2605433 RepID=A0A5D4HF56_9SPHI|nr:sensor histidine kinase [Sphingobacterium phlebotomi]TYR38439.1 tetratricopeptide repeat protein [Sphingobacterium phlebotomi]
MNGHLYKKVSRYWSWLIFLTAFGLPFTLFAQSADSLILAHTDKNGKVNIKAVIEASKSYFYSHPTETFKTAERTISIAERQKEPLALAQSYQFMGTCYFQVKADYDSSFHYLEKAEQLFRSLRSKEATEGNAMVLHNFGTIEQVKGEYVTAIDYYIQALKLFDEAENTKFYAYTLNNISTMYSLVKDYQKAEKYARDCILLSQQADDAFMVATGSIALTSALMEQGKYEEVVLLLEKVKEYGERNNDPYKVFLYHLNYGHYLMAYQKDYPLAVKEYEKARELTESIGDEWEIMRHNSALSEAYFLNNQYEDAHSAAQTTLLLAEKLQSKDKKEIASWMLAQVNARNRDFETAYQQLSNAYLLKDTLYDETNQQQMAFLETVYQTEKKELKIDALEKQRKLYILLGIAGAVILFIALAFAFIRYRLAVSKRKLAEEEAQRLEQEKQLVAVQATLDGETAERTRLAKDLHDGLGSMLSLVKFNLPQVKDEAAVLETIDVSRFQKAIGMLDDSIQELRRVAHHMMPESLLRYGLKASLTDFCAAIPIADFHYFGDETRLSEKMEIMIYRCIHELVNNALKHAQANHINVQLVQEEDRISFTVQDDGIGFDQEQVVEGMGLQNVRQRVDAFHGKMNVYSSNQGTEIHVELELTNKET